MNSSRFPSWLPTLLFLPLLGACSGSSSPAPDEAPGPGRFESASPQVNMSAGAAAGDPASSGAGGTTTSGPGGESAGDDAGRAIEEADIVKIDDGVLYALSRYGGLSTIDVSVRDGRLSVTRMGFPGQQPEVELPVPSGISRRATSSRSVTSSPSTTRQTTS